MYSDPPLFSCSVSVSQFMLDKLESKLAMHAGSSTAWSMESNQTAKCPLIRPLEVVMIPSTPSSVRLELENMFPELCSVIWSQQ